MTRKMLSLRAESEAAPTRPTAERLARLKERARDLRRDPTEAETLLWEQLSGARLGGIKFSRKTVVGTAIVDFACPTRWIVISITQPGDSAEVAELQDARLTETGIRVLRFSAEEIGEDLDRVVGIIVTAVNAPFERREAARRAGQIVGAGR